MQQQYLVKQTEYLLQVTDLSVQFNLDTPITILQHIQFCLNKGKTLCLVGESGCGKTMTALALLKLLPEYGRIISGQILFNNKELTQLSEAEIREKRGKDIGMIFQEPMTSLNPVIRVGDQIAEPLIQHLHFSKKDALHKAIELLKIVGISSPEKRILDYPHQLSGGIRQRIMIAMALSCSPSLLIADEPTTALDVTIQRQLLVLLRQLIEKHQMSMLLITHNLGVVAEMADEVCVMYAGEVIENASVYDLFKKPAHPYTQALMNAIPLLKKGKLRLESIPGTVPALGKLPIGCNFRPRCPLAHERCIIKPPSTYIGNNHNVSCWLYN
ncbi:ABC transporter ATP-binding protein [Lawsonia intracellularis]|uniref:Oligopeptide ABC transporter n=1 Tax=Lawsonia intracellularis (strain PHE/MN1-00) TaxID=363253 RepID=Q1MPE2_LAWIP|nr:ABC transporter ATP-binding protein [Lawsonia intracellularis]AGC50517.1 oligopeptide/dipeptide ABC transporter ATPase [Lawsonia intracellularis N343]KAA0204535.1 ABC transporter ATP-binding protein [Lawsonia intracellularis]MBZ3892967.1 ABC transporter ATP-binding protein [Lawsonia intracellularis]OMQ02324.1 ABC transporter ATP-binding protein [Lawsonia intracellularis]RBN32880.1 ABC transporter ATP-binding protein [Lawsonia intracellularis]